MLAPQPPIVTSRPSSVPNAKISWFAPGSVGTDSQEKVMFNGRWR